MASFYHKTYVHNHVSEIISLNFPNFQTTIRRHVLRMQSSQSDLSRKHPLIEIRKCEGKPNFHRVNKRKHRSFMKIYCISFFILYTYLPQYPCFKSDCLQRWQLVNVDFKTRPLISCHIFKLKLTVWIFLWRLNDGWENNINSYTEG